MTSVALSSHFTNLFFCNVSSAVIEDIFHLRSCLSFSLIGILVVLKTFFVSSCHTAICHPWIMVIIVVLVSLSGPFRVDFGRCSPLIMDCLSLITFHLSHFPLWGPGAFVPL